jgi:hypothetical protein
MYFIAEKKKKFIEKSHGTIFDSLKNHVEQYLIAVQIRYYYIPLSIINFSSSFLVGKDMKLYMILN